MSFYRSVVQPLMFKLPPETAHRLVMLALKRAPFCFSRSSVPDCPVTVWGKEFACPLGLAAGFDKDAEALTGLTRMGFGFVELGTVTPKPQSGNDKPRVFRDGKTQSVINRMGFPGKGLGKFKFNLQGHMPFSLPIGVNIGKNKITQTMDDIYEDYKICLTELAEFADYFVVNVSSPNTPGLRDLQSTESLTVLLSGLIKEKQTDTPLLVKISPDLDFKQLEDIAGVVLDTGCDGVVISNTTLARPETLPEAFAAERGGLSGDLLKEVSTDMIRHFYHITEGKVPIIGVGGISNGQDMMDKMRAGASLVQIYTAFIFEGPALIVRIMEEFCDILQKEKITDCKEIIGIDSRAGLG